VHKPRYSGPNRSGMCVCGHSWEDHHLGMVMNQDYWLATDESYVPQECEYYGFNEMGGCGPDGKMHCQNYRDTMEEAQDADE